MYEIEPTFWLKLLLLLVVLSLVIYLFNALMRRWLKVEKRKLFSYNHVNDKHKKIDWKIRGFFIAMFVIGGAINIARIPQEPLLFLQPWFLLFVAVFVTGIVQTVMERKYAKNPNDYIYTASELIFLLIILVSVFTTNFFGIF